MRFLVVLLALVTSPAAPKMELRVTAFDTRPGAVAETEIDLSLPAARGPVTIVVPAGYAVNLARRPGAVVGTATVTAAAGRRSSVLLARAGTMWAASSGLQISVAPDRLTVTPPPGATDIDLDLQGVLTNPASPTVAVWRAVAGALEARSVVPLPQRLGLRVVASRGRVTLRGRLTAAGRTRPAVNIHLALASGDDLAKAREIGVAKTRSDGSFALLSPAPGHPFTVLAYVNFYVASCATPCISETVSPPPSETVAVSFPP